MNFGKEKGMMAENHVKWMEQSFTFCFCCFDMLLSLFFFLTGPLWSHFKTFVLPPSKLIPSRKFSAALGNSNTHIYREKGSEARSPIKRIFQKRIEEQQQQKIRQNPLLRRRNTQIKLNSDI